MESSFVELRHKMKDILKALERNETVKIFYRGKIKGIIVPAGVSSRKGVKEHTFFGMARDRVAPVADTMAELRGSRLRDL